MSNDKTLATVKHGGCVQLGSGAEKPPQELPKLIVTRGDGIPLPDQAAAIEEFKRQCLRRVEAEYPHLSAQPSPATCKEGLQVQPSPGGQGDAWDIAELVRTDLDRQSCPDAYMRIAMESVVKHLAARQPVCATVKDSLTVGGGQPVGETVAVRVTPGMRAAFRRAYREGGFWADRLDTALDAMMRAAPPAQAVGLAEFKALYRAYVLLLESGRDRIIDLGGTCDPVDVMEANDIDLQAARRVIDSLAVGK
ncbi:hypothetical protein H3005_20045 [Stenotrophomonas sp. Br8]|uniref:hypothetical protein n=1 Tax=Stenotrophomonas sp. Br8 TaxID=2759658 RepID=UPI00168C0DA2|nr:hypothetical protein [Stenotrophomonas sp. Br8]MBD3684148.1 hypothetical protein [Stenotrophomonas sp. Br8]